jgi:hypothetical protein
MPRKLQMAHHPEPPHTSATRSSWLDAPRFTRAQCDALFAAVLVDDTVDLDAELPRSAYKVPDAALLVECYRLARQLWQDDTDRDTLLGIVRELRRQGTPDPDTQVTFKHIRAKFKQLRATYATCDATHAYPPAFHRLAATMGRLQDAFKNRQHFATARYALAMRCLLMPALYRRIAREIDAFTPTTSAAFARYVQAEMGRARAALDRPAVTGHEFHTVRKIVSRQAALHCALTTLRPACDEHATVFRCLATVNGLMGAFHDELVEKSFRKTQDYDTETFAMPVAIRERLTALVQWFGSAG